MQCKECFYTSGCGPQRGKRIATYDSGENSFHQNSNEPSCTRMTAMSVLIYLMPFGCCRSARGPGGIRYTSVRAGRRSIAFKLKSFKASETFLASSASSIARYRVARHPGPTSLAALISYGGELSWNQSLFPYPFQFR
jgi:hypothetical protein